VKNKLLDYRDFITEGLINTYPITEHKNALLNNLEFLNNKNIKYNLIINDETFNLELSQIDYNDLILVNSFCNNLGYFVKKTKVYRGNQSNLIQYNSKTYERDVLNNDGLVLYYEAKFATGVSVKGKIYHATNVKNIERILNNGLYPRSVSKMDYHIDRIYLSLTLNDCVMIIPKLRAFDYTNDTEILEYVIFEVESGDIKYHTDPSSNGVYTHYNIPKESLNLSNMIYMEDGIIDFDDYKINKITNQIYLEFYKNGNLVYKVERKQLKNNKEND